MCLHEFSCLIVEGQAHPSVPDRAILKKKFLCCSLRVLYITDAQAVGII